MKKIRIASFLFPPLGLVLLWRSAEVSKRRRILGTIGIGLYSLLYVAGIVALLMRTTGLELEWQGGFPPVLTWHKTHPNYDAVEASRRAQPKTPNPVLAPIGKVSWPGFRGPHRDGHADDTPIATNWPANGLRPLWKEPIGGGYASFAIADGRAFTIEQRRDEEAVTAYDVANGHELWAYSYPGRFDESLGGEGPRATPYFDDGKVYSLGAMGDLLCLDAATGKMIWKVNILTDNRADMLYYAEASSPLIMQDKVIVQPGGTNGRSVVAYDKLTGKPIWHSLDDPAAYSSPMLVELAGKEQLLVVTDHRAVGLQVRDGALLWATPWIVKAHNRNNAQPVLLGTNRFLLSAGYGTGSKEVEVSQTSTGFTAKTLWQNTNLKNKFTSSVFLHDYIYGLDEDMLVCLDPQTGERKWKEGRYGYGQIVAVGDYLIVLGGEGQLALVKASPDHFEEVGRFQAIEGKTWNHPAMFDGKILVRNAVQMACFDLRESSKPRN
jgi:outer membrane protein assembly factor BamB